MMVNDKDACPRCGSTNPGIYISEWDGQAWPMTRPPGCPNEWHDRPKETEPEDYPLLSMMETLVRTAEERDALLDERDRLREAGDLLAAVVRIAVIRRGTRRIGDEEVPLMPEVEKALKNWEATR